MFEESGLLPVVDGNCREKTILTVNEDLHLAEWRKKVQPGDLKKYLDNVFFNLDTNRAETIS
jgi:hypothetical protein